MRKPTLRRTAFLLALAAPCAAIAAPPPAAPAPTAAAATPADFPPPSPAAARRIGALIESLRQAMGCSEKEVLLDAILENGADAIPLMRAEMDRHASRTWPQMVHGLGATADPRVIPVLRREYGFQTGQVATEVLYALALAGDPEALVLTVKSNAATASMEQGATPVDLIAGALGPKAVPVLVREIPRRAQDARAAALGALGTVCDASAVDFLLGWSKQPNGSDRRYAVIALARIGDPRSRERLIAALADPDVQVREAAAEGVGVMRDPHAVPPLLKTLDEPRTSVVRYNAIWALGLIGGPEAAAGIARVAAKAVENDLLYALQALGNTHDPAAAAPLAAHALKPDASFPLPAVEALAGIPGDEARGRLLEVCGKAASPEAGLAAARELVARRDPRAIPCVVQRLREEINLRQGLGPDAEALLIDLQGFAPASTAAALEGLADTIPAPAIQHRLRMVAQGIREVQEVGPDPVPWIELLDKGSPSEVDLAIQRLGELGDPRAIEPLRRLFGRIEPDRAWRIPEALGKIGSERATPFLVALLTDDLYRVASLGRARDEAARALAAYSRADAAAEALKVAFLADKGRSATPLLAYARMRGLEGVPALLDLKGLLLRRRCGEQVERHERVNWAIRLLRAGKEIPLSEVRDR